MKESNINSSRESPFPMIPVDEAIAIVLQQTHSLSVEEVPLNKAVNRRLAQDVISKVNIPAFPVSIMDGYAVVASDGEGNFPIVANISAGSNPDFELTSGNVAYITTGALVPKGADAVVQVEHTAAVPNDDQRVEILQGVSSGKSIRPVGSDLALGETILSHGTVLEAGEIGLLATVGISRVSVYRRPTVGILSTGNELVSLDCSAETVDDAMIRDSNRPMLVALMDEFGVDSVDLGICADNQEDLKKGIASALDNVDVLVTSGGVSMGQFDYIKGILEDLGTIHFGRILMKPGKPTTFAKVSHQGKSKLVFGLPGNPVSAFVTTHLIVRPCLDKLQGASIPQCLHAQTKVRVSHAIPLDAVRPEYHRAVVKWDDPRAGLWATSTGKQQSSRLLRGANALLCLPTGTRLEMGTEVTALMLGKLPSSSPHFSHHGRLLKHWASSWETTVFDSESKGPVSPPQCDFTSSMKQDKNPLPVRLGILCVSDSVSNGVSDDESSPIIEKTLRGISAFDITDVKYRTSIDDSQVIKNSVLWMCAPESEPVDLLITTGGTGFAPRDVTPDAVRGIIHREAGGLVQMMMNYGLRITPKACLSRPVAGIHDRTLIITLPGSSKAVQECLESIIGVLPHALYLVKDVAHGHHKRKRQKTDIYKDSE